MGGKASAPPPPDYSAIAAASEKAAEYNYALGKEQLAWAKQQYGMDRQIADQVIDKAMTMADMNIENAQRDRAFYEQTYRPLESQLAADAATYGSKERRELEVGRAEANVAQEFAAARQAATRNLEAFGIDPSSTRYAALDVGTRTQEAAARAAAGNQASQIVDATQRALRSEAINVGKGYPGQVAATYGTALQAGNQAVNSGLATTASGANTMGTAPQWSQLGNQSLQTWGNTLNMQYQNQLDAFKAENAGSSGWGSALGAGLGLASSFLKLEEGGSVGGDVPPEASPTRGQAIDDVPARLNVGEFVVPEDVARWKGEEFFQKLIEQSRKAKETAPAKPQVGIAPVQEPTFSTSRPSGALPVG